jgi:hypothetical protein
MIYRRVAARLRAQDWLAITIEILIVVIGVFIGTWVANMNQERLQKRETSQMLDQLRPEVRNQLNFFTSIRDYFGTTSRYAKQALAAWNGDRSVSDEQFVIAAYQASQIYGIGINAQVWALKFGGEQLRDIDDPALRRDLAVVLTADYDPVQYTTVATPYREDVRRIIPNDVQDRIRSECGDRTIYPKYSQSLVVLPKTCSLKLGPAKAASAAAALRANPKLANELNWHLAAVATYLQNAEGLEHQMRTLQHDLDRRANPVADGGGVR